jgi:two-component SAPR family response regulator
MNVVTRFIIIDDDEFNNKICTVTIEKISSDADIKTFMDPLEGFLHLVTEYAKPSSEATAILFLDINMPVMNGWEFLDRFEELDESLKKRIKIYILSSSVDKRDMERARLNKNVQHYLVKPLTRETIRLVTHSQNRDKK